MKLFILGLVLVLAAYTGCITAPPPKPDCYCDGPIINGSCDSVVICIGDNHWCPLDGGACRR